MINENVSQIETQVEFPFKFELEPKLHEYRHWAKKLYGFFDYVSRYYFGSLRPFNRRDYALVEFEDAELKINKYGEVVISRVNLHIEIEKFRKDGFIWLHGYMGWLDFEILFKGDFEVKTKKGGVVLKLIPKSRPEINIK